MPDERAGFRQGRAQGMPQTWPPILGSLPPRVARPTGTSTPEQVLEEERLEGGARNSQLGPEAPGKLPLRGSWKDDVALSGVEKRRHPLVQAAGVVCANAQIRVRRDLGGVRDGGRSGTTSLERKTETFLSWGQRAASAGYIQRSDRVRSAMWNQHWCPLCERDWGGPGMLILGPG